MRWWLALLVLMASCREPAVVEEDVLAHRTSIAHKEWGGVLIEFGSPRALPHLSEEGWSHGESAESGTFRWASEKQASFTFASREAGTVFGFIDCEPFIYPDSPTQYIGLTLNGEPLTDVALRPGRDRYPVELPLIDGENRIDMQFRYAGDPNRTSSDRRRLAVKFFHFDTLPVGDAPVERRAGPFSTTEEGIVVPSGAAITWYADIEERARLAISGVGAGELRVTVRTVRETLVDEDVSLDVPWEHELTANGPVEVTLRAAGSTVTVAPALYVPVAEPAQASAPVLKDANIVLIFLDGANALRMGLYGYEKNTTPAIDALGAQSIVFDHAVSQAVYTIASMGSVLTSQYPERHQSISFADKLRDEVVTFPEILAANGFRTAGFSGNAVASEVFGLHQGYDEFFPIWKRDDYTGHGDSVLGAFEDWLDDARDVPNGPNGRFFAYVHFREPHFPYNPPAPFDTRFGDASLYPEGIADAELVQTLNGDPPSRDVVDRVGALYDGNLAYADDLVRQLLEGLEERGLTDNTIVLLTADHGEAIFEHDFLGHNTQLYEESIRIPMVLKIPGEPARRVDDLVELIDVAPTILELAGIEPKNMDGRSLWRTSETRTAYSRTVWTRPRYSARTNRYKMIWHSRTGERELYDLAEDPGETTDVHASRPFVTNWMEQRLFAWLQREERLRELLPPDRTAITDAQRELLGTLGYGNLLSP